MKWNDITPVDPGKWYHFALTYDGKTYKSYLDGKGVYNFDFPKKATYPGDLKENEVNETMKKGVIPSAVAAEGKLAIAWGVIKTH